MGKVVEDRSHHIGVAVCLAGNKLPMFVYLVKLRNGYFLVVEGFYHLLTFGEFFQIAV